jgi:hypothetical protein
MYRKSRFESVNQEQDNGYQQAKQNAGGNREIYAGISSFPHNVSRQFSDKGNTTSKLQKQPDRKEDQSNNDQHLTHTIIW